MMNFRKLFIAPVLALALAITGLTAVVMPQQAHASAMGDTFENKIIDWWFRAQAVGITGASAAAGTGITTQYVALATTTGSDTACGTEVSTSGTAYARVGVTSSLANWAGTQSATSTTASSGTGGTTSNNAAVTFPAPTGSNWGSITEFCVYDAATSGNLLWRAALTTAKTVNAGDAAPSFAISAMTFQIDN